MSIFIHCQDQFNVLIILSKKKYLMKGIKMNTIFEPKKEISIKGNYDVIVCGGGPAGVAAALASARSGVKTCLLEVNGCLGGIWTAGLMPWIIDHDNKEGIMKEIREDLLADGSANIPPNSGSLACDVEAMKLYLEQKCLAAGIDILLHCRVVAAITDQDKKIQQVITESKSGREAWSAKVFVDATGDGDLSAFAGCEFDWANEKGLTQPMSMIALLCGIKLNEITPYVNGFHTGWGSGKKRLKDEMLQAGVDLSYAHPTIFYLKDGLFVMMANHEYKVSAINTADVTRATLAGRQEVNKLVNALRSQGGVWKNLQLAATSEQIGTREGRRIKGLYEMKIGDMIDGSEFDDASCKCCFGVDVHSTDPDKDKGIPSQGNFKTQPYDIPIRAQISKDINNLLMAGRCISGDFLAHSSYRVTGDAVPMGEAAGKVAAISAKTGQSPADVPFKK